MTDVLANSADSITESATESLLVKGKLDPEVEAGLKNYHPDEGKKAKYLSYRLTGFTEMESITLSKIHHKSVLRWREDDKLFRAIDLNEGGALNRMRDDFAPKYLNIEFTRNFRLVLEKDFTVLMKAVLAPDSLNKEEHDYLLKLRTHYSAQQMAMISQLLKGGTIEEPFNFTKQLMTLKRERETLTVQIGGLNA